MSTPKRFVSSCGDISPDFTRPLSAVRETRQTFIDRRLTRIGHWGRRLRRRRSSCRRGRSCWPWRIASRQRVAASHYPGKWRSEPGAEGRLSREARLSGLAFVPSPKLDSRRLNRARRVSRSPSCSIPGRRSKGVVNARSPPPWSSRPPIRPSGTTPRAARARATCAQENLAFLPKLAREKICVPPKIETCARCRSSGCQLAKTAA